MCLGSSRTQLLQAASTRQFTRRLDHVRAARCAWPFRGWRCRPPPPARACCRQAAAWPAAAAARPGPAGQLCTAGRRQCCGVPGACGRVRHCCSARGPQLRPYPGAWPATGPRLHPRSQAAAALAGAGEPAAGESVGAGRRAGQRCPQPGRWRAWRKGRAHRQGAGRRDLSGLGSGAGSSVRRRRRKADRADGAAVQLGGALCTPPTSAPGRGTLKRRRLGAAGS